MRNKILLTLGSLVAVVVGVVMVAAGEAHIVNVTAEIENALRVHQTAYAFGTVFPQEYFDNFTFTVGTSDSFSAPNQTRVRSIDYVIKQKPKCKNNATGEYVPVDRITEQCPNGTTALPSLCPYLSKEPLFGEPAANGVSAFHNPDDPSSFAHGSLHKSDNLDDIWLLDLAVPCFEGMCSQDWNSFVHRYNPDANPNDYILPAGQEHQVFGCDLWIETTRIY